MQFNVRVLAAFILITSYALMAPAAAGEQSQPRAVLCTWVKNATQLQAIRNNLAGTYCLANDIDAGVIANFDPLGDSDNRFTGRFFGNNRIIRNLTIDSAKEYVGLFGIADGALIRDVGLVNANVIGTKTNCSGVGGLLGSAQPNTTVLRVHVTGLVQGKRCFIGGIAGSLAGNASLAESWSSAEVIASDDSWVGGAVGFVDGPMSRTYATGPVTCRDNCKAGGLIGELTGGTIDRSHAVGPVTARDLSAAGGLAARQQQGASTIQRSYAAGPVTGGIGTYVGGLVGQTSQALTQTYAIGLITGDGGFTGGLIGQVLASPVVTNSYWDTQTSGQPTSAGGLASGLMTTQFRAELPPGFGNAWASTEGLSYPFLNDPDIYFASPLATLVRSSKVFVFEPVDQLDAAEYMTAPLHADEASLAAVYTMVARAVGIANSDTRLDDVKIDRFFWDDATQTATWRGPVKDYATLGVLTVIPAGAPLDSTNVIGRMDNERLVILRGAYRKSDGSAATHWLLGTLYTTGNDGSVSTVVANDPVTGAQIEVDPGTKRVLTPGFPLANFRVNGYQAVTVN